MKKKCKVVALATSDNNNFALVKRDFDWVVHEKDGSTDVKTWGHEMYHLYIISDDKIEVGNLCFIPEVATHVGLKIEKCLSESQANFVNRKQWKKLIASTDPLLNLPAIPEWFVKEYAEKQTSEVEVIYDEHTVYEIKIGRQMSLPGETKYVPRTTEGELVIGSVKETWTREEIEFVVEYVISQYIETIQFLKEELMSRFDTVEQDMKEFEEDERADAYKRDFEDLNFYEGL